MVFVVVLSMQVLALLLGSTSRLFAQMHPDQYEEHAKVECLQCSPRTSSTSDRVEGLLPLAKSLMINVVQTNSCSGIACSSFGRGLKNVDTELCENGLAEFLYGQMSKARNDVVVNQGQRCFKVCSRGSDALPFHERVHRIPNSEASFCF